MRASRLMAAAGMTLAVSLLLLPLGMDRATADDPLVRWADVIGIMQAGNLVGAGTGQVTGGGQPWSTTRGTAMVNLVSGDIHFNVQGLVLAGGNAIGTPASITAVKGTIVCDTDGSANGGNSTLVDTPLVPLSAQGNADFQGSVGQLPAVCFTEPDIAFLVRIGAGRWIANGAVRSR